MGSEELRATAVGAARRARDALAQAMAAMQRSEPTPPQLVPYVERTSAAIRKLYVIELGDPDDARAVLEQALPALRELLSELQLDGPAHVATPVAIESLARALAFLHPAASELSRSLDDLPTNPAFPLTRLRPEGERRSTERAHITASVGIHTNTQFLAGTSGDVSIGGVFVAAGRPPPVGTELTVSLILPDGHQVAAEGTVTWIRTRPDVDGPSGMGIRFDDVSVDDRAAIERYAATLPSS